MQDHHIIHCASNVLHSFKQQLGKEFRKAGIDLAPTHLKVMRLVRRESPCTSQSIAQILKRDKAQVTRLLQELINQNLLEKTPHPSDKRSHLLCVSHKGTEMMTQMSEAESRVHAAMYRGVTEEEIAASTALLTRLQTNLDSPTDSNL